MSFEQSFELVKTIIGIEHFEKACDITKMYPSVISEYKDTAWTKTIKIIGINPRITKTYWGIIKYALSFPEQGIHLMPLFETGDNSLYVQNFWDLNNDFSDENLIKLGYDNAQKQLKLIINILHAMGKIVGFDALAHVDNFSKIVLLNPKYFEWIKLNKEKTKQLFTPEVDYNKLYLDVQEIIINTLNLPQNTYELEEQEKNKLIFPKDCDEFKRRMQLRKVIREAGYEPIPVIEHYPVRPIIFEKIESNENESWATFNVKNKSSAAKIFGALTPYKLYETDNNGYPIQDAIIGEVWEYFSNKIYEFQKEYNFDFLRADMAHNQISHSHNNELKDTNCPELWAYTKSKVQQEKPYFATMAEAFYSSYYIDGIMDMINKDFDIVLGNMNFKKLDIDFLNFIDDFLKPFRENFDFSPCVAIFTNDCDLPENNKFYSSTEENLARVFISLFLNLPSYMGIGFEQRDINPQESNKYSNYYVKPQTKEYEFGGNTVFLNKLNKIRTFYCTFKNIIDNSILTCIYSETNKLSLCFEYTNNQENYLIVVNLNAKNNSVRLNKSYKELKSVFSNSEKITIEYNDNNITLNNIQQYDYAVFLIRK